MVIFGSKVARALTFLKSVIIIETDIIITAIRNPNNMPKIIGLFILNLYLKRLNN